MKKDIFINGIGAVTVQGVWRPEFFEESQEIKQAISYAQQPAYKELIPAAMIRRMSRGIKMGIYAAQQALDAAALALPDAIITGTGLGCSEDSEKFLRSILDNDEAYLTPTSFIQSTHNTVAAQIALRLQCKGYNFTYVNRSVSFESALLDGLLQLQADEAQQLLVGGVDEVSDHTYRLLQLVGHIKPSDTQESVKNSSSAGANYGEGAVFFALSSAQSAQSKAKLLDVSIRNACDKEGFPLWIESFLADNGVEKKDVDALVLGYNGDGARDDHYTVVDGMFDNTPAVYYKHLVGQFDTSSSFALALGATMLHEQRIPGICLWDAAKAGAKLRHVLLYNQYQGKDHALVLLQTC